MSKGMLTALFVIIFSMVLAQETIESSITHDGGTRQHILYVPDSYDGNSAVPLVLNFHGYTSNARDQMNYGDFRELADEHGFIIVHPQGTRYQGSTHFNVGGWTVGSTTDDVDYSRALIDFIEAEYNIDPARIYSTGMSNGGYMSFLLACQLNEKIAAVASVTGSMTPETFNDCKPSHPTPIMQIHGTNDNVVSYGGTSWSKSVDEVLRYWITYNHCNDEASPLMLPDINPDDGSTVEEFSYTEGDADTEVIHLKVYGGGHTWPGNRLFDGGTNKDIDASAVIWEFFDKYDINGLRDLTSQLEESNESTMISIYPNPARSELTIDSDEYTGRTYKIIDSKGGIVLIGKLSESKSIDISRLDSNVYFFRIGSISEKFVVVR